MQTTRFPSPAASLREGGEYRCAGGRSYQNAFPAGQVPHRLQRILVGDLDDLIIYARIQNLRYKARARAHQLVRSRLSAGEHGRALRLDYRDVQVRQGLPQLFPGSGYGTARSRRRHKGVKPTFHLLQYFRRRSYPVNVRVSRILELLRNEASGNLLLELQRLGNRTRHAFVARCQHDLRAVRLQYIDPFLGHIVRHNQDSPVTLGGRNHRQANAGIPACRLNNGTARLEESLFLGGMNQVVRRAVLPCRKD